MADGPWPERGGPMLETTPIVYPMVTAQLALVV